MSKIVLSVLYGVYATKQQAKVETKQLNEIVKTKSLILRSANGIRNEIKKQQSGQITSIKTLGLIK